MKKVLALCLIWVLALSLSGCGIFDMLNDDKDVVDLGGGDTYVRWNLVWNNNEYRPVQSAYFEFNEDNFKYYENGVLKKEGTHRITYSGVENTISPLHIDLNFGNDKNGFAVYDYLDCYTEDSKENLHQFTILTEGYHIEPVRTTGGVPVRDYHLSDMPYAFGTYVKEGTTQYTYANGKVNYLNCAKLDGTFCDENGNKLYFANNAFSSKAGNEYARYTIYMRYENNQNNTVVEGTIFLSFYEDFDSGKPHDVAMIYVLHGDREPGVESGTSAEADYLLMDFTFGDGGSITFAYGEYFYDNQECDFNPSNFVGGTYYKQYYS